MALSGQSYNELNRCPSCTQDLPMWCSWFLNLRPNTNVFSALLRRIQIENRVIEMHGSLQPTRQRQRIRRYTAPTSFNNLPVRIMNKKIRITMRVGEDLINRPDGFYVSPGAPNTIPTGNYILTFAPSVDPFGLVSDLYDSFFTLLN
jgi:hypothetical protein